MNASTIAKYILIYEKWYDRPTSNLRLQKLLYFVQENFILKTGSPCFEDSISMWNYGPTVESVYFEYNTFGGDAIKIPKDAFMSISLISNDKKNRIAFVLDLCSEYSTPELVEIATKHLCMPDRQTKIEEHQKNMNGDKKCEEDQIGQKQLHIWMREPNNPSVLIYPYIFFGETERALKLGRERVDTVQICCCKAQWLQEGYCIFLHFPDGSNKTLHFGENDCTDRIIRSEQNLFKLLMAGEFGQIQDK